jgi:predicted secreted Zn-dependent protease
MLMLSAMSAIITIHTQTTELNKMINQLIQQLPKYEQRHAANAVIHARNGNMLGIDAAIRCARTEKVKQIYLQIIKAL